MKTCPNGHLCEDNHFFCSICGYHFSEKRCQNLGCRGNHLPLPEDAQYCPDCGQQLNVKINSDVDNPKQFNNNSIEHIQKKQSMSDEELYNKAKEELCKIWGHYSSALENTQYSGCHSVDLSKWAEKSENKIWEEHLMPLVNKGYRPACLDYYHKLEIESPIEAYAFLKLYRENHPGDKLVDKALRRAAAGGFVKYCIKKL